MIDSEKRDFMTVMTAIADMYDKKIKPERVAVYWEALKHRDIADVRGALNKHVQDAERGRFFPLPADVSAQLPREESLWLGADEAWARCPKSEGASAAMCEEMQCALSVAGVFIEEGDIVAARMTFKDTYNRLVDEAKMLGNKPKWYVSRGCDADGRYAAEAEAVKLTNMALPPGDKLAIPDLSSSETISLDHLLIELDKYVKPTESGIEAVRLMKAKLGIKSKTYNVED